MKEQFSLERVVKSEASFDPKKLIAFQSHYMSQRSTKATAQACLRFLQRAELVADPAPCEIGEKLHRVVAAAGDRITMAGDILQFEYLFQGNHDYLYDEKAFQKRLVEAEQAGDLINEFNVNIAIVPEFEATRIEAELKQFCQSRGLKVSDLVLPLRIALTGQPSGFSLFETMAILGRQNCIDRINRTLDKLEFGQ